MAWKVAVLVPFAFDDEGLANRRAQLDAVTLSPDITFDFVPVKAGPDLYDSYHDYALAEIAMFEVGVRCAAEGYDALGMPRPGPARGPITLAALDVIIANAEAAARGDEPLHRLETQRRAWEGLMLWSWRRGNAWT